MHSPHDGDSGAHGDATSPNSPPDPRFSHIHRPNDRHTHPTHHLKHTGASPIASGSGSGSSGNKFPRFSSGDGTPSSSSRIRTADTPLTPPTLVGSPQPMSPGPSDKYVSLSAVTDLQAPSPVTSPPPQVGSPPIPSSGTGESSTSSDEQLPTRASIRAWAKATPAGPPRNTPSPMEWAALLPSSPDENFDRQSLTRSAGHHTVSSPSQGSGPGPDPGPGTSSSDEDDSAGSRNLPFPDESSGNVADIDSSGSGGEETSPQDTSDPSPSQSPPSRELLAPAPLHPPASHPRPRSHPQSSPSQSSPSQSPPPAVVPTTVQVQEQQERIDRRGERRPPQHPGHSSRRRHRDRDRDRDREHRERRPRPSNPTPPHQHQQAHQQNHQHTHSHAHSHSQSQLQPQARPLRPLRIVPDVGASRLPPPPPLRPLQVLSGGGGVDVLDEIARMLHTSRRPLARPSASSGGTGSGFWGPQRRENDVLDDICLMINMSRRQ